MERNYYTKFNSNSLNATNNFLLIVSMNELYLYLNYQLP